MDEQNGIRIWLDYDVEAIRKGADSSRFLFLFQRDFQSLMGEIPCTECKSFRKKLDLFQRKIENMANEKCDFKIISKYDGVYGYFNKELTNKKAEELAGKHKLGFRVFEVVPKKVQDKLDEEDRAAQKAEEDRIKKEKKEREEAEKQREEERKKRRAEIIKNEEARNKERRKARLESWTTERLKKKAKKIGVEDKGSRDELVKRIMDKE